MIEDVRVSNESKQDGQITSIVKNLLLPSKTHQTQKEVSISSHIHKENINGEDVESHKCSTNLETVSSSPCSTSKRKNESVAVCGDHVGKNGFKRKKPRNTHAPYEYVVSSSDDMTLVFVGEARIPTSKGVFRLRAYRDSSNNTEPIALIAGNLLEQQEGSNKNVPVRVHDQCFTSEVFGCLKCDCKSQLDFAMEFIQQKPCGLIIYSQQEGRGIGLANKILAYSLQEREGLDTVDANLKLEFSADQRQYKCIPFILSDCNISSIHLMTNNPRKLSALEKLNVKVTDRIPIVIPSTIHSQDYLKTKAHRMGHIFNGESGSFNGFKSAYKSISSLNSGPNISSKRKIESLTKPLGKDERNGKFNAINNETLTEFSVACEVSNQIETNETFHSMNYIIPPVANSNPIILAD